MRPAASQMLATRSFRALKLRWVRSLIGIAVMSTSILSIAHAQVPDRPALSPPGNHEVGRIEEVITATDKGYRYIGYVLTWRSTRIVVADTADQPHATGGTLEIVVYRSEANGHRVLRFKTNSAASNEEVADPESANSSASITQGTAQIESSISADSDGYRFVGYFVTWHDKRIFVVDPKSDSVRAVGDTINFRVFRTGLGASPRLSFSL